MTAISTPIHPLTNPTHCLVLSVFPPSPGRLPPHTHTRADALAVNFASQCGFCTPGITVALAAAAAAEGREGKAGAVELARGLDGNLCRCTGWRPIIDTCRVRGAREGQGDVELQGWGGGDGVWRGQEVLAADDSWQQAMQHL